MTICILTSVACTYMYIFTICQIFLFNNSKFIFLHFACGFPVYLIYIKFPTRIILKLPTTEVIFKSKLVHLEKELNFMKGMEMTGSINVNNNTINRFHWPCALTSEVNQLPYKYSLLISQINIKNELTLYITFSTLHEIKPVLFFLTKHRLIMLVYKENHY